MRTAVVVSCISLAFAGVSYAGGAIAAAERVHTRIPPEALGPALEQLAQTRDMQVLYFSATVKGMRTSGATGDLTADEALTQLLTGTGLTYRYVDHNAVTILPVNFATQAGAPASGGVTETKTEADRTQKEGKAPPSGAFRVAQVDGGQDTSAAPVKPGNRQSSNEEFPALQEVIVTAQKYRQRAFNVPISLDVVTGQELQQQGITNLTDLQYDAPGLFVDGGENAHRVYLRGVGNTGGNGPMVGEYIDEADVTGMALSGQSGLGSAEASLYDLSRVEVLRGPQGTLYGDGSMGGVIRYITNMPDIAQSEMSANVAAGLTEYGAPSQRTDAMLNMPLMVGTLGLRFAGLLEHDGGWVDQPAADLKNINSSNLVDARVEALWQPNSEFKLNAMQIVHRDAFGIGFDEDANGNLPEVYGLATPPHSQVNFNLSNITATVDFAGVRLLNSTSYFDTNQQQYDLFDIEPLSAQFGSATYWYLSPYTAFANKDLSDELRLSDTGNGPWHWMVGSFYKHFRDDDFAQDYAGLPGPLSSAYYSLSSREDLSSSWAGFANTSYELFNRLTLGAGVRYFKDHETAVATGASLQGANFTSTDPRFYVQYGISQHVNLYATASKGFRSGGFNFNGQPPYQPEVLWSYDLGTKIRFPKNGIRANVDLFYDNYTNYVSEDNIPPFYLSANVGKARIKGADIDLTWQPVDQWRLSFNTEILNTTFLTATSVSGFAPGDRLPFAPTYSFTASIERNFRWDDKPAYAEFYYYEISRVQERINGFNLGQSEIPHFLNFRAGVQWNDNLRFGLRATNLLNDRGSLSPSVVINGESTRPQPRTLWFEFGVSSGQRQ